MAETEEVALFDCPHCGDAIHADDLEADAEPEAVAAIPGIPAFVISLIRRYAVGAAAPLLHALTGKELLKEKIPNKAAADALAVGAQVDLGSSDNARGATWDFPAVKTGEHGA